MIQAFPLARMDYIFFVSGMVLLLLALAAQSLVAKGDRRLPWSWLALFGFSHGASEWMNMLVGVFGDNPPFAWFRGLILAVSFLCLFEFGRVGAAVVRGRAAIGRWIVVPFLIMVPLGLVAGGLGGAGAVRYALGLPAAVWAAWAFFLAGRSGNGGTRVKSMTAAGAVMMAYATVSGFVVPVEAFAAVTCHNPSSSAANVGISVQVLRASLACVISILLWQQYHVWRRKVCPEPGTERVLRFENMMAVVLALVLVLGWVVAETVGRQADLVQRTGLVSLARSVAAVESPDALQSLVGDVADVDRPAYRQLRQQCREICNAVPDVRYVYLLAERGGKVVFLLDTEPDQVTGRGGEPTATPGDKYDEATAQMRGVFQTGRAIAEGPYTDKWGSFVSGLAPVRHPETGGVIGVLGIDINASRWASIISSVRLWAILVTALIAGLMLFFFVLWRKSHEEAEADSVARDRLQRQQAALVKIATSHAVATGDFQAAARCITEMTVGAVGVERAGIWMGSYQEGRLYCADIYDRTACQHAEGLVLNATSYPEYFKALETGRAIDASDCTKDPPLSEMLDLCRERGVVSALDAPIRVSGALVGVVCLEHTGASRQWLPDEVRFVAEVADQVAHVLINVERKKAIEALEKAHHELEARVRDRTAGLSLANEGLRKEIIERKRVEVERDRIEEKLRQAKKMECLGVLAGGIAHDFNNILMAILGNLELARMELSPGMPVLEYLNDADKAARRASELSRQMLAYSGRAKFLVQSVSLNDVIRDMIPTITSTVANAAQVVWKYGDDLPAVEVDVAQIRQILLNLVTNASEAMGESGGTIHLITGIVHCDRERLSRAWLPDNLKEGFYVFLEVIDTGCGMEAHTRERIFDPFFTTKFTGRGLGLPAVLGIVRGHGGAIELESTFGQGTTVRLLFPSSFTPLSRCAAELPCPEGWKGHGTILLVDDEDPVRLLGVKLLDRLGFRSLTACDGLEAVQVFREHQDEITCVLLDLTMPRMDGRETLLALKRIKSGVRVMLCSGYAEEEAVAHFNEVPPDGFIQKPYSLDDLACKLMVVTSGAQDTSVK